jgi:hypothetical protein
MFNILGRISRLASLPEILALVDAKRIQGERHLKALMRV